MTTNKTNFVPGKLYVCNDCRRIVQYVGSGKPHFKGSKHHCFTTDSSGVIWTDDNGVGDYINVIKEYTTKPTVQWDALPKWANRWFAIDESGQGYCYASKPNCQGLSYWSGGDGNTVSHVPPEYFTPGTCDWKESLIENPAYANT